MPDWNQGLQGAGGGAMAGGAYGGPLGAAIGGGLGLLGGIFGSNGNKTQQYQDQLSKLAAGYGSRTAPQAGNAYQGQNSQFRSNQAGLIAQLEAMSRGEGPSAAQGQMREAMDRAAGAQSSAAAGAGGRGVNAGEALRGAMNNTAAIQSQGARDSSILRSQEQMQAMGQLGQVIGQGRQADEGMSQFNAGANNQNMLANLQAKLQTMGINDESQLRALMAAMGGAQQAGGGMGTSLLAGGASAVPGLLQYGHHQGAAGGTNTGGGLDLTGPDNPFNSGGVFDPNSWNGGQ